MSASEMTTRNLDQTDINDQTKTVTEGDILEEIHNESNVSKREHIEEKMNNVINSESNIEKNGKQDGCTTSTTEIKKQDDKDDVASEEDVSKAFSFTITILIVTVTIMISYILFLCLYIIAKVLRRLKVATTITGNQREMKSCHREQTETSMVQDTIDDGDNSSERGQKSGSKGNVKESKNTGETEKMDSAYGITNREVKDNRNISDEKAEQKNTCNSTSRAGNRTLSALTVENGDVDEKDNGISGEQKTKTLVKKTDPWRPRCIYRNNSTGQILVGMKRIQTMSNQSATKWTGKVTRYNSNGQRIQTIPCMTKKNSQVDYRTPFCITENCNRDIIVSDIDLGAVVVVDHLGQNRFPYKGHQSESQLLPRGVCTDALSNILVCDDNTSAIQMIDKDGQFLSFLLTKEQLTGTPHILSIDKKTHLLWIGSLDNNVLSVYRYLTRYNYVINGELKNRQQRGKGRDDQKDRQPIRRPIKRRCRKTSF
ncbi:uncharacterized protein LOC133176063 [Saccostrea echinata]|uniref:uncharacterized protein LOC133176063 n=1 Tax=Saccostrea echinata TaxID=191078 RepID=UPI002A8214F5|nr:uncharacterized protein LOC133176063 [Saccostrea echinata]